MLQKESIKTPASQTAINQFVEFKLALLTNININKKQQVDQLDDF